MNSNLQHQLDDPNCKGVEILSIGTELLLGNIVNTNAQWISAVSYTHLTLPTIYSV